MQQREPVCDGRQPATFRRGVDFLRNVGGVHDLGHLPGYRTARCPSVHGCS
jgi:hypothetical protein